MIRNFFYTILIFYAFLLAYPKFAHSKQGKGFQIKLAQSSVFQGERDFLTFSDNKYTFKKFAVPEVSLHHQGYNFSILADNLQVVPVSFINESNYASMPKKLGFNVGYNFSPYLGIASGLKKSMIVYDRESPGWLSLERKFEYKYYGESLSVFGTTPAFKGFFLYGGLDMQRVITESKKITEEVGVAFKPKPWFLLFLGYNTETVDAKTINTIFSGQFGVNMIAGLSLGFSLDF